MSKKKQREVDSKWLQGMRATISTLSANFPVNLEVEFLLRWLRMGGYLSITHVPTKWMVLKAIDQAIKEHKYAEELGNGSGA